LGDWHRAETIKLRATVSLLGCVRLRKLPA
jgi:hypothetical protein